MRFSEAGREFHLLWRHQVPSFSGSPSAFFRSLKGNPAAMNAVRRMLRPPAGESDDMLLEKLARMVESGRILVGMRESNYGGMIAGADEAAPPENRPAADHSSGPAAAEEEPTFPPHHDQLAQAAALRQAARSGAPFCEECEKAKRAPAPVTRVARAPAEPTFPEPVDTAVQVHALTRAAQMGLPFCEVCEQQSRGAA